MKVDERIPGMIERHKRIITVLELFALHGVPWNTWCDFIFHEFDDEMSELFFENMLVCAFEDEHERLCCELPSCPPKLFVWDGTHFVQKLEGATVVSGECMIPFE